MKKKKVIIILVFIVLLAANTWQLLIINNQNYKYVMMERSQTEYNQHNQILIDSIKSLRNFFVVDAVQTNFDVPKTIIKLNEDYIVDLSLMCCSFNHNGLPTHKIVLYDSCDKKGGLHKPYDTIDVIDFKTRIAYSPEHKADTVLYGEYIIPEYGIGFVMPFSCRFTVE